MEVYFECKKRLYNYVSAEIYIKQASRIQNAFDKIDLRNDAMIRKAHQTVNQIPKSHRSTSDAIKILLHEIACNKKFRHHNF